MLFYRFYSRQNNVNRIITLEYFHNLKNFQLQI